MADTTHTHTHEMWNLEVAKGNQRMTLTQLYTLLDKSGVLNQEITLEEIDTFFDDPVDDEVISTKLDQLQGDMKSLDAEFAVLVITKGV